MELLIVIAIIAILAAALIVGINPARQFRQARDSTRWRHLDSITTAIYSYAIEHGGGFPEGCIGEEETPKVLYPSATSDVRTKCELNETEHPVWCTGEDLIIPGYLREAPPDPLECNFYQIEFVGSSDAPEGIKIWSTAPETWHPYPEGHEYAGDPNEDDPRIYLIK